MIDILKHVLKLGVAKELVKVVEDNVSFIFSSNLFFLKVWQLILIQWKTCRISSFTSGKKSLPTALPLFLCHYGLPNIETQWSILNKQQSVKMLFPKWKETKVSSHWIERTLNSALVLRHIVQFYQLVSAMSFVSLLWIIREERTSIGAD